MKSFKATAFICLYNEADIIGPVLTHLHDQGLDVHIIDNWSTDGSADIAREFPLVGYEKFPVEGPSQFYSWIPLLNRVEELAHRSDASWCVHHDSDEIRRSPRRGENLLDGLSRVQGSGHSAINFQVYHFLPVDDTFKAGSDPERHFKYFTVDHGDCRMRQVKAWKNTGRRINLVKSAGHFADFPGVTVYPERFVLKHYPLRSSEQAARKVLTERIGRYDPIETAKDWHVQYRTLAQTQKWLSRPEDLQRWTEGFISKAPQDSSRFDKCQPSSSSPAT